jgi:hypothetical protein
VVQTDPRRGRPRFWGEAGHVGPDKIEALVDRYPDTHFAVAKWDRALDPFLATMEAAVHPVDRTAPVDLLRFPSDSAGRFVDEKGRISTSWDDVNRVRVGEV